MCNHNPLTFRDKLIRVHPTTPDQVETLKRLQTHPAVEVGILICKSMTSENRCKFNVYNFNVRALSMMFQLDFWTAPHLDKDVDIHVTKTAYSDVTRRMSRAGLKQSVLINDLQRSLQCLTYILYRYIHVQSFL